MPLAANYDLFKIDAKLDERIEVVGSQRERVAEDRFEGSKTES